jgi:hypothetical protein
MEQAAKKAGGWFTQGQSGRWAMLPMEAILDKRLKAKHFSVLSVLALHANRAGVCTVTLETIAQYLDYTKDHVWKTIRDLKSFGWATRSEAIILKPSETQLQNPDFGVDDLRVVFEIELSRIPEGDVALRVIEDRRMADDDYKALIAAKKAEIVSAAKVNKAKKEAAQPVQEQIVLPVVVEPVVEPVVEMPSIPEPVLPEPVAPVAVRKPAVALPACPSPAEARRALLHYLKTDGERLYSEWSIKNHGYVDGYGDFYEAGEFEEDCNSF